MREPDIVERLRRWVHAVDAVSASDLMDEAADEIERLRSEAGSVTTFLQKVECLEAEIARLRLTDAETVDSSSFTADEIRAVKCGANALRVAASRVAWYDDRRDMELMADHIEAMLDRLG